MCVQSVPIFWRNPHNIIALVQLFCQCPNISFVIVFYVAQLCAHCMFNVFGKWMHARRFFIAANKSKSLETRSGLCGWCLRSMKCHLSTVYWFNRAVCSRGLSCWSNTSLVSRLAFLSIWKSLTGFTFTHKNRHYCTHIEHGCHCQSNWRMRMHVFGKHFNQTPWMSLLQSRQVFTKNVVKV